MNAPSLQKVKVKRFKKISEAMVALSDINLFVGPNNSGKTSFIQGLHFAISLLQTITYQKKWVIAERPAAVSFGPSELIYVPTESIYSVSHGASLTQDRAISFHFDLADENDFGVSVYKGKNKNISLQVSQAANAKKLSGIATPYSVFCPGLAGIPKNEALVSEGVLRRAVARGDANVVLRNVLYRLSKTEEWGKFLGSFSYIFPNVSISVKFDESFSETIDAYVVSSNLEIPLELAGTGMLQMAQILSYIHYFSPKLLILDEPDSHLHPNNQRAMCKLISDLSSSRSMQVIMASHSRHVLDVISRYGRVISASQGAFTIVEDEQELSVLMDLGALDLKERVIADGVQAIVLTEDTDVRPIEAIVKASKVGKKKYEILSYGGCSKASSAALLVKFLRSVRPGMSIYVHRDRDFMNEDDVKAWSDQIMSLHAIPVTTKGVDAESGFLNPKHLSSLNPPLTEDEFQSIISESRLAILEDQTKRGVNRFIENERSHGRHKIDPGGIAIEITKLIRDEPERYMSGKDVLGKVKSKFQEISGKNLNVFQDTIYIDPLGFE